MSKHFPFSPWARILALGLSSAAAPAAFGAQPADPCDDTPLMEGCPVVNPVTGDEETIYAVPDPATPVVITRVITGSDSVFHAIWTTPPAVGTQFPDPLNAARTLVVVQVLPSADEDLADAGYFDRVVVRDLADVGDDDTPPVTWQLGLVDNVTEIYEPTAPQITPSPPAEGDPPPDGLGNAGMFRDRRWAANGSDGSDGGGLRICIIKCFTIGKDPSAGSPGNTGPTFTASVANRTITSNLNGSDGYGVWVSSTGGNGGQGGDAYSVAGVDAAHGGAAGAGGSPTATVAGNVSITTSGTHAYGIFVQSIAGQGGNGGSGYALFSGSGGSGGPAAQGGSATGINNGQVITTGAGAIGLYVQSLGGGGGNGGNGWGIVGDAGTASVGGHGGSATATNNGSIHTYNLAAHGVVAQSVGGKGGDGGRAGGIVSVGGDGNSGGNGGAATASNTGSIITEGARAFGMLAQSVGGGGGNGGTAGGIGAIGGGGSAGGIGAVVNATNSGSIETIGAQSHGIVAQSIGGGGGTGAGGAGLLAIGGKGGTGGRGDNVTVNNLAGGDIQTWGAGAAGVLAQSIGGGGGAGGGGTGGIAIGGDGGGAGEGRIVTVNNAGEISTLQTDAKGIIAQSIGGGGGFGAGAGGAVSVGGKGGGGGAGGQVIVGNTGAIVTWGQGGDAIVAQSIGGGGGDGGSVGGLVALGGSGGTGGSANTVSVTNSGDIDTAGARARGVLAQSIGGGGGNGGNSGGLVSIGGSGNNAGHALQVTVSNTGSITTAGAQSSAIEAQSIGGGGGSGGSSNASLFTLGGSGAGGGNGGVVQITNGGALRTTGADSAAILAQSIGGGGGNGGSAVTAGAFVGVAIGSDGGPGGTGGDVTVTLQGQDATTASSIRTDGERSAGILAQSVGGSGGNGGGAIAASVGIGGSASIGIGGDAGNGNTSGTVRLVAGSGASQIDTRENDSAGVVLQSVGGSGGNGGYAVAQSGATMGSLSVAVGGEGGSGAEGGDVLVGTFTGNTLNSVGLRGSISTTGERSTGLLAQSVGGGGGNGGFALTNAASASAVMSGSLSLGVGGDGGSGGVGGDVAVGLAADISTQGAQSTGLLAQSVGGGGGNGGGTVNTSMAASGGIGAAISIGIGGDGGTGGTGGTVRVTTTSGNVSTRGDNSSGIVMQSVGGGGGNGGYSINAAAGAAAGIGGAVTVGLGGDGGAAGAGSSVNATLASVVRTRGDNSAGVVAQSIGGGGGNGGFNVSGSFAAGGGGGAAVAVGLGGDGGGGGAGGAVNVASNGATIVTEGDRSAGFVAQSIGGGGGNGGFNVAGSISAGGAGAGSVSVGLGGNGAGGGTGGAVTANVGSSVSTGFDAGGNAVGGDDSTGILVQSVGGGGGNGGFNVSGGFSGGGGGAAAISVGLGGSGGTASNGGQVTATSTGAIQTAGDRASGFVAQSIGGGGGNGGANVSGSLAAGGVGSGAISVGLGGAGGGGGDGGNVLAGKGGDILTRGDHSAGMVVQSIGGGGGNGGGTVDAALAGAGVGSGAITVGIGGSGGSGGDAGVVKAKTTEGTVSTAGDGSGGIVVQSVGGGGGSGGYSVQMGVGVGGIGTGAISVGLGGSGGSGGDGRAVCAAATAGANCPASVQGAVGAAGAGLQSDVYTQGDDATGILVQSVGGGGGNGGFSIVANAGIGGIGSGAIGVGLGGSGGVGGAAGNVSASSSGTIITQGDRSSGFVVQSIGGGGGNGGFNVTGTLAGSGIGSGAVNVGLGGNGGGGGTVGWVDAQSYGDVSTAGDMSTGILAQSIGGGGGNGGFNVNVALNLSGVGGGAVNVGLGGNGAAGAHANTVDLLVQNDVTTAGRDSAAVVAQSIGGGGGNGGFNVTVAANGAGVGGGSASVGLGGQGAGGGDGRRVTANMTGDILTQQGGSTGLLAQSVGGGGGNGGFNVAAALNVAGVGGGGAAVGLGGSGGDGGDGGVVNAALSGNVYTAGGGSAGVVAQSLGGGGGNGGLNVTGTITAAGVGSGGVAVGLGGSGGGGGDAANVTATVQGDVATGLFGLQGDDAAGVLAQSLGGGGGNGGLNVSAAVDLSGTGGGAASVGLGGSGGDGGDAGEATADVTGDVSTRGARSTAVAAQSIGGGGGNGGINVSGTITAAGVGSGGVAVGLGGSGGGGGDAQRAQALVTGNVGTLGNDSAGVLAQSLGGGGGNGGINVSGALNLSGTGGGAVGVGIGGFGGDGGIGRAAEAVVTGDVGTAGINANGVTVQSVGGGGGNGGINVTGVIAAAGSGSGAASIGIGGFGGGGGQAGTATGVVTGAVSTTGAGSHGLLLQSLGGGGGNGGLNVSGMINASGAAGGGAAIGIGGFGGDGGASDQVTLTRTGITTTTGEGASGIVAQSIGGGGGNGGINVSGAISAAATSGGSAALGVGGFGGSGGAAGDVRATVRADSSSSVAIATQGEDSAGLVAQSLGGGGGNGGINVSGAVSLAGNSGGGVALGLGGFGGDGGQGGWADAIVEGDIITQGANSHAVTVQSIGGGGGNGGINISGALSASQSTSGAVALGLGGFGGGGADSGAATGQVTGQIQTAGDGSYGVLAQSLGGGGGNGGLNVSGALSLSTGTSVAASIGVGGFGGGGGNADYIEFVRTGDTVTTGANAHGIVAQSVGGGGGNGGINISAGIAGTTSGSAYSGALGLGGFGGSGGDGDNVALSIFGDVLASGLESDTWVTDADEGVMQRVRSGGSSGALAQSVGGGGGNGGMNVSGGIAISQPSGSGGSNALSLGVGGFGGGGGDAGMAVLDLAAADGGTARVTAVGDGQFGVAAQSIGGGGGNGGINVSGGISMGGQITLGVGGFGGSGGRGENVRANVDADIRVSGADAVGFLAESIGGGGGNGGINISGGIQASTSSTQPRLVFGLGGFAGSGNTSGNVEATQNGFVHVDGSGSTGVLVQSIAGGGGNGGLNVAASASGARRGVAAAIGIGGNGGDGADAGSVTLASDGEIIVDGREHDGTLAGLSDEELEALSLRERGNGILAQSIGGGGGNGGMNVSGVVAQGGNELAVGVGGSGGGGGNAGTVSVTRGANEASRIVTLGNQVSGLAAQSVGGGGGNAGVNIVFEASTQVSGTGSNQARLAIGGSGGTPGDGAAVDVVHAGEILTAGDSAHGLFAQSVGGGGGNANINFSKSLNRGGAKPKGASYSLAVGGGTGNGGTGGAVSVEHSGRIATEGNDATALFAQSVGGGGGNAEADDSALGSFLDAADIAADAFSDTKRSVDIEIGRSGGIGGDGGNVEVDSDGTLTTLGDRAVGIRAQSVGAGGGVSGTTSASFSANAEISLQVGVGGAAGGRAGNVRVESAGIITTAGTDAHAIHAQSVGGGGGEGGSVGGSLMPSGNSVSVGVGGTGGTGGVSGTVDVANAAALRTEGDGAYGIHAQSIGGGGGDGGYAGITQDDAYGAAVDLVMGAVDGGLTEGGTQLSALVGGNGGVGALADRVSVGNTGTILTSGREAHGINAQSIGGGGGVGGMVVNGTVTMGTGNNSLGINVGGQGGDGAQGAAVSVTNDGVVWTQGDQSVGIRAQSVGGGGGDAGMVAVLNVTPLPGSGQNAANLNIGGNGGTGSAAGDVTVVNRPKSDGSGGVIFTEGAASHGIFAQSLGGGGGNGSSVLQMNFSTDVGGITAGLSVGGKGGDGAQSGAVSVTNEAQIETEGDGAHGVFAQSIGGGGGNGGMALAGNLALAAPGTSPLITVGGEGGTGAEAGDVTVTNSGSILTHGANAQGILAQSIGGGGGNAGMGIALSTDVASVAASGVLSALLGGHGGDGGRGGNVTVNHSGDITVLGEGSQAVVAESINGGGGSIAMDFNGITSLPGGSGLPDWMSGSASEPVFEFSIGGWDKKDSAAGVVTLNYTGTFGVAGDNGAASRVQAIGGGGGTYTLNLGLQDAGTASGDLASIHGVLGGTNGVDNDGGDVTSQHTGDLISEGDNTPGLFAQSVGGGGGRANVMVDSEAGRFGASSFSLGAENGAGEEGGDIAHTQQGSISTLGSSAHGAVLQSIGGGGGVLSFIIESASQPPAAAGTVQAPLAVDRARAHAAAAPEPMQAQALGASDAPLVVSAGSNGGSGLHGGDVQLVQQGDVSSDGDHALGFIFQSIGAGGGITNVTGASALDVRLGATAGASGDGGALDITNTGNVLTAGAGAHGVFLQSIGGGGGAVFTDAASEATTVTTSAANSGNGGAITFTQAGDIRTRGAAAHGLFAQSLGGGGGFVDGSFAGSAGGDGAGGAIDLQVQGDIIASGEGSTALFAQSSGAAGGGNIEVTLGAGHYLVGGMGGTALALDGGAQNLFTNGGVLMTLSEVQGLVITGGAGNDVVVNHGLVLGNIDLGGGANSITNLAGATLYTGDMLSLGADPNLLLNEGLMQPGAGNLALRTQLAGSFRQSPGAVSDFELDFGSEVLDSVLATGTAQVGGDVNVSLLNVHLIKPGHFVTPLYSGLGGVTDLGLQLNPQQSIVIDYDLAFSPTAASLDYTVDFAVEGLQGNRIAIGEYFNGVQAAGSSPALADLITKFVLTTDLASYSNMLTQLGAEFYAEQQAYALGSSQRFGRSLRNCGAQNVGRVAGDSPRCIWGRLDIESTDREAAQGSPEGSEFLRRRSFGYQYENDAGYSWGFGFDFSDNNLKGYGGNWAGKGTVFQAGGLLRRTFGAWSAGGVLMLGGSEHEVQRRFNITQPYDAGTRRSVGFTTAVLDVARRFEAGDFTVTPGLALGGARMHGRSVAESGGPQSLQLVPHTDRHLWAEPSVNLGFEREVGRRQMMRAYARVAALRYLNGAQSEVRATLVGAPAAAAPMRVSSDLDRTHWLAEGGLEFVALDRVTFGMSYSAQRSELRETGSFALRFAIPFH